MPYQRPAESQDAMPCKAADLTIGTAVQWNYAQGMGKPIACTDYVGMIGVVVFTEDDADANEVSVLWHGFAGPSDDDRRTLARQVDIIEDPDSFSSTGRPNGRIRVR